MGKLLDYQKKYKHLAKEFGYSVAIQYFASRLFGGVNGYVSFVKKMLSPYAERACKLDNSNVVGHIHDKYPVWIMWWQGYEKMPDICKACFNSIKQHMPEDVDLVLITQDNFREYIDVPGWLLDKLEHKNITITLFSDWFRNALLSKYGGFWIDSTIYCTDSFDAEFLRSNEFWSIKTEPLESDKTSVGRTVSQRRWGSFIQKGPQNSKINRLVLSALSDYLSSHDVVLDYFTQNFLISLFYELDADVKHSIDAIPFSNSGLYDLDPLMNEAYDADKWQELRKDTSLFKLTWKRDYSLYTENGEETFYSHIVKSYISNDED